MRTERLRELKCLIQVPQPWMFYRDDPGLSIQLRTWCDVTTPCACNSWVFWGSLCEPFAFDLRSSCFWDERVPVSPLMQSWEESLVVMNNGLILRGNDFIPSYVPERVRAVPFHQSCRIATLSRADTIETIIGIIFARSKIWSFPEAPKKHNPVLRFWKMMAWMACIQPRCSFW